MEPSAENEAPAEPAKIWIPSYSVSSQGTSPLVKPQELEEEVEPIVNAAEVPEESAVPPVEESVPETKVEEEPQTEVKVEEEPQTEVLADAAPEPEAATHPEVVIEEAPATEATEVEEESVVEPPPRILTPDGELDTQTEPEEPAAIAVSSILSIMH